MSKETRSMMARGLTLSNRGSIIEFPEMKIKQGMVTGVEYYGNTTVVTLTIAVDLDNMTTIGIQDR